ncbi:glycoside hydrolase family 88 protein [Botryobasidium botryosum FD-172 SS1]|uniref:Glycoside hydrolase family 88 protein n=1 Tax=Botryobasidium botryosum (strain FD-172 SS1) TaxID=930990 RepID=A0A067MZ80_BOTB1|nr:glycoside hydrolase family 88 protein [Botryobasidium botryosum FD-172 SS1]
MPAFTEHPTLIMVFSAVLAVALSLSAYNWQLTAAAPSLLYSPLIAQKVLKTLQTQPSGSFSYPQYTNASNPGIWHWDPVDYWTSGFLPATLYALHEREKLCPGSGAGVDWLALGRSWSAPLVKIAQKNSVQHDVGFISYAFVKELELNPTNTTAKNLINQFAKDLTDRYNPAVGCTASWDGPTDSDCRVIMDNMMNLELLFQSSALTGNKTLIDIAISHADKTIENHIRSDGGSFHVVDYDAHTGAVKWRRTSQGYADNSTWARGQAWGIYGFATIYKYTTKDRYLKTAQKLADYFLSRLSASGVPNWDFDAPASLRFADTSAGTIAANGFLLLAELDKPNKNKWTNAATKLLEDTAKLAWKPEWQSLLSNGTVNQPAGNFLTGIVYGDYYYITAGNTLLSRGVTACP